MSPPFTGGCSCGQIRYSLSTPPIIVNCCHCTYCQRETGSAFAVNAFYESDRMTLTSGTSQDIEVTPLATKSGRAQHLHRCPKCKVVMWSLYGQPQAGDFLRVLKVGTLDQPREMPVDVHIYTGTKQKWVELGGHDAKAVFEGNAKVKECWSKESLDRMAKVGEKRRASKEKGKGSEKL
jgi:hypothetical protein